MPAYDASDFDPPAPIAHVSLRNCGSSSPETSALMLIDTGADITLLPRDALEPFQGTVVDDRRYELLGFDGRTAFAQAIVLDMIFLNRTYRGLYLITEEKIGILGRDILNHVELLLDGPRRQWSEQPS